MSRKLFLQIEIRDDDGKERRVEYSYDLPEATEADADLEWFSYYLSTEAQVESVAGQFSVLIPDPNVLYADSRSEIHLDLRRDMNAYYDAMNSAWLRDEIFSLLSGARGYLARSRAYHELQPPYSGKRGRENDVLYKIHLRKMDDFHLAVKNIKKLEDMILQLVFEALGGSLEGIDKSNDEWERQLTLDYFRELLKNKDANDKLKAMSDDEYNKLREIIGAMKHGKKKSKGIKKNMYDFWQYRHALEHRLPKSVDLPELYTFREERPKVIEKKDKITVVQGFIGSLPVEANWNFLDLYNTTVEVYRHYLNLIVALLGLPTIKQLL